MATLVLGTVGRALGGPLGGLAGTFLGGALDRGIFGGGKPREGRRSANLAVQSAAYGEALPRLYGTMRVAGNLVWTSGIRETLSRSGGGKRGPATNNYVYSASFAVIVSARPIRSIGRIWADGKLLRAADGGMIYPAVLRTYTGAEDQPVDFVIAAAEGIGNASAYRGRALVVFDDLPLADYGNRIPNLTFEVVADDGSEVSVGMIIGDLCRVAGISVTVEGDLGSVQGFAAAQAGGAGLALQQLVDLAGPTIADDGTRLLIRGASDRIARSLAAADLGSAGTPRSVTRGAAELVSDALTVGFSDPARDYQYGLQRVVRRSPPDRAEQRDLDVALSAPAAKRLAGSLLRRAVAARTTGKFELPWRYAGLRAGDTIQVDGDATPWRVRRTSLVGPAVELEVTRLAAIAGSGVPATDPGRPFDGGDAPPGATLLHVLDLPPLTGALPTTPRLWLAAAGASRAWRRADIAVSVDGGASYAAAATITGPAVIGTIASALPPGNCDRWDRRSSVDVVLLSDSMWLESRNEAAVLAGANLALVGDELIQFAAVEALGDRRFRLSTLLRGRRGTEHAAMGNGDGDRFILLDPDRLGSFDPATDSIGSALVFKAIGPGDDIAAVAPVSTTVAGLALRPLSPVFMRVEQEGGDWRIAWTRRSRAGWAWLDGVDVPLGEATESYRVTIALDDRAVREAVVAEPRWTYAGVSFAGDGGSAASRLRATVVQIGDAGPGTAASIAIDL